MLNALSIPFVLVDGSDAGAGLDTASRSVTRQVASLTNGVCGSFSDDAFAVSSPDTGVMSGNCYRYVFTIADRVGNVSATATSAAVQVDTDAPDAPTQVITESAADAHAVGSTLFYLPTGSGTFTVTATATDAQSGVDKVTFPAVGSGFVRTGAADDSTPPYSRDYTWSAGATAAGAQTVTSHDLATNTANGSFTLTADSTAPATAFTAPAAAAMLDSNVHAITATATDVGGAGIASVLFEVSDGGPFAPIGSADTTAPYSVGWDTSSVTDGPKTLRATATDNVGNTTVVTRSVAVDKVVGPPETSIGANPTDPDNDTTPQFTFTATETPATFECNLDGGGWSSCATPFTVSPALSDGSHTFEVRATDAAGNTDATVASYTWVVDGTLPTGSLTAPGAGAAVSGSAVTVSSNSADGLSGVEDARFEVSPAAAGTWSTIGVADTSAPYAVAWDTTAVGDGDYDLRVTTRDEAGNAFVSALRTVVVDNTAPSLTVNADTTINIASPDPETVGATATDTGTGIDYVKFEQCNSAGADLRRLGLDDADDRHLPPLLRRLADPDGRRPAARRDRRRQRRPPDLRDRPGHDRPHRTDDRADGARRRGERPWHRARRGLRERPGPGRRPARRVPADHERRRVHRSVLRLRRERAVHRQPRHDRPRRRPLRHPDVHERRLRQLDRFDPGHDSHRQHAPDRQRHRSGRGREPPRQRRWR